MVGAACCANPPVLSPTYGAGHVMDIAGLSSYVTGNISYGLAILLISDIFGYQAPILRMLADKVAASGFYVVVPDFLHGDPYDPNNPDRPMQEWIKDHDPVKASEEAVQVIKSLKHEHHVSKVGAVGFCWGGKVAVELTKHKEYLKAGVLCHPALVTVDDIEDVKVPIEILGAELDGISPPALLKQFQDILKDKKVDNFVKIFPNVSHGFTVRYDTKDPAAVIAAEEAHGDILDWLVKYLKPHNLDY